MSARLWLLREAVVTNRRIDPKANFEPLEESDEALRIKEVLQVGEGEFVTVANPHGDYRRCEASSVGNVSDTHYVIILHRCRCVPFNVTSLR